MLINYIIIAHNRPEQLERLIRRLNDAHVRFYIHIDKVVDDTAFKELLHDLKNVFFLVGHERNNTPWSDIGFVYATLSALRKCIQHSKSKGYCILLSGIDYPIVENVRIHRFLKANYGKNYISIAEVDTLWPQWKMRFERYNFHLPKQRTEQGIYPLSDPRFSTFSNLKNIFFVLINFGVAPTLKTLFRKRRKHPRYLTPKGGSAWWALPIETIDEILKYLNEHPDFLKYHEYTHVPDEIVFHTLVHHIKSAKDIDDSLTYVNWQREGVTLPVTFRTAEDYKEIMALTEPFLYARKFDEDANFNILDCLDQRVGQT